MGCCFSSPAEDDPQVPEQQQPKREAPTKSYAKPRWKYDKPLSAARLQVSSVPHKHAACNSVGFVTVVDMLLLKVIHQCIWCVLACARLSIMPGSWSCTGFSSRCSAVCRCCVESLNACMPRTTLGDPLTSYSSICLPACLPACLPPCLPALRACSP
jgi:hypothetical protein